jgi:hypothetical protein
LPEIHLLAQLRAGIARAERDSRRTGDQSPADAARREYAVAKIEDYVRRTVDAAPPLTIEQRTRLASLLTSSGGAR